MVAVTSATWMVARRKCCWLMGGTVKAVPPIVVSKQKFSRKWVAMKNVAQMIPNKYRTTIYSVLATLVGLEAVFNFVPDVWEGKVLAALVVLGFGVAVGNVGDSKV